MTRIDAAPEAIRFLTDRRAVTRDEFQQLPDGARLRAFTVARQTENAVIQDTLEALSKHLQTGGTMATFRDAFPEVVKPFTEEGQEWHLRLIVQQNVRQAQAVGAYAQRQRLKAAFPFVKYQAGINPRDTHKALDGKIFEVDDPFLAEHTPPWEFGCNCDLIPQTAIQVGRARAEDQGKEVEAQRVVPGNPKLESLVAQNKMPHPQSGAIHPIDMRPPIKKGGDYSFRPDQLTQDVDLTPYEGGVRDRMARQLQELGYRISQDGLSASPPAAPPSPPRSP